LQTIDRRTPLLETFKIADDVLRQGVQGISELITEHGLINLDFADVRAIMANAGSALMGIGRASGDDRAQKAAQQAIESPLIEVSIDGARGVLFNVTGGYDMSMSEIQEAAELITSAVAPDANIIFGATLRPEMEDELIITVIATGFDSAYFANQSSARDTFADTFAKPLTEAEDAKLLAQDEASAARHDLTKNDLDLSKIDLDNDLRADGSINSDDFANEDAPAPLWNSTDTDREDEDRENDGDRGSAEIAESDEVVAAKNDDETASPFPNDNETDDKYDTPSFLRRRFGRKKKEDK